MKPVKDAQRYDWVDYAKGICIMAVVAMYINSDLIHQLERISPGSALLKPGWFDLWVQFARPFRMPDFFLLSGLFLSRVIDRPWRTYLDSRVVHYLYFFLLWTVILFLARVALGIEDSRPAELVRLFLEWLYQPFAMLWFIEMLAIYSLVTRFTRQVPAWLMFVLAAALQVSKYTSDWDQVQNFGERYVYFYAGYAFAPAFFQLAAWAQARRGPAVLVLVTWAAINSWLVYVGWAPLRGVGLALGFAGACGVIVLSSLLCKFKWTDWLRYLGEHSIVIYLGFYMPMQVASKILTRKGWVFEFGTVALLISAFSIVCALLQYWAVRRTFARFLFARPAWARLVPAKPSAPGESVAQPAA